MTEAKRKHDTVSHDVCFSNFPLYFYPTERVEVAVPINRARSLIELARCESGIFGSRVAQAVSSPSKAQYLLRKNVINYVSPQGRFFGIAPICFAQKVPRGASLNRLATELLRAGFEPANNVLTGHCMPYEFFSVEGNSIPTGNPGIRNGTPRAPRQSAYARLIGTARFFIISRPLELVNGTARFFRFRLKRSAIHVIMKLWKK